MTTQTTVLIIKGKSDDYAHSVSFKNFENKQEAYDFCEEHTNNESKYWTIAEVVTEGYEMDTFQT